MSARRGQGRSVGEHASPSGRVGRIDIRNLIREGSAFEGDRGKPEGEVKLAISSGAPRISQIGVSTNNVLKFTFSATGGIHYQVQFKNELSGGQWSDLGAETTANSNTVPVSDNLSGVTQRFYRVLQLN